MNNHDDHELKALIVQSKAELSILDYRLKQENIRLKMAEYRASKLNVRAEVSGSIIVDNPDEWRGRPVEVGQKVLMVVDPENINLRIWLPEADNVNFSNSTEVKVLLNAFPDDSLHARIKYVAQSVSVSPEGVPSIMAEGALMAKPISEKESLGWVEGICCALWRKGFCCLLVAA